jgi:predicted esterase
VKNLQDLEEDRWLFQSFALMDGTVRKVEHPQEIILLLHGYNERGRRIFRKLLPYLPKEALILAPNGPFPLPRPKEDRLDFGFAWYFFDRFKKTYLINQDLPKNWLREFVRQNNPDHLPLTIIGFSQGGYLAPLAGLLLPETKLVVGLGCEFRSPLLPQICPFPLVGLHGEQDEVISPASSQKEAEVLQQRGFDCEWFLIHDCKHEVNANAGLKVQAILEKYGKIRL